MHLPFPHSPEIKGLKIENLDNSKYEYYNNLNVCDAFLKEFYEKYYEEDSVLIITSDHHLRIGNSDHPFAKGLERIIEKRKNLYVPLIIKLPNEKGHYQFNKEFHGRNVFYIIKGIIEENISTYRELDDFLNTQIVK